MGDRAIDIFQTFKTTTCCSCGQAFAMNEGVYEQRLKDRQLFYCPAGHAQHFSGETDVQKLKREYEQKLAHEQRARKWAEESKDNAHKESKRQFRRASALKGALTKTRKRIVNGVCPCCSRTFTNLGEHMNTKHPEFKKKVLRAK